MLYIMTRKHADKIFNFQLFYILINIFVNQNDIYDWIDFLSYAKHYAQTLTNSFEKNQFIF